MQYQTPSLSGVTDQNGTFQYHPGEDVTFSVGNVILGTTQGGKIITPLDLYPRRPKYQAAVMSFLQSIDEDGTTSNGIQINQSVGDSLNEYFGIQGNESIPFPGIYVDDNYAQLAGVVSNRTEWIDEAEATADFESQIEGYIKSGDYSKPSDEIDPFNLHPGYFYATGNDRTPFVIINEIGESIIPVVNTSTRLIEAVVFTDSANNKLTFMYDENGYLNGISDGKVAATVIKSPTGDARLYLMNHDIAVDTGIAYKFTTTVSPQGWVTAQAASGTTTGFYSLPTIANCLQTNYEECAKSMIADKAKLIEFLLRNQDAVNNIKELNTRFLEDWKKNMATELVQIALDNSDWATSNNVNQVVSIAISAGECASGVNAVACVETLIESAENVVELAQLVKETIEDKTLCGVPAGFKPVVSCYKLKPTAKLISSTKLSS